MQVPPANPIFSGAAKAAGPATFAASLNPSTPHFGAAASPSDDAAEGDKVEITGRKAPAKKAAAKKAGAADDAGDGPAAADDVAPTDGADATGDVDETGDAPPDAPADDKASKPSRIKNTLALYKDYLVQKRFIGDLIWGTAIGLITSVGSPLAVVTVPTSIAMMVGISLAFRTIAGLTMKPTGNFMQGMMSHIRKPKDDAPDKAD